MKQIILLSLISALLLAGALPVNAQNYSKITYVHSDADGTPFAATDEQGNLEWQIDHYPYGDEYSNTEVARKSDISFAGKPYDEEIGLSYFGARWYDPAIGRFTGVDPVPVNTNDYRSFNRYSYGYNNPYKYIDPDGRYVEVGFEAASLAIGVSSLIDNIRSENFSSAAVDAGGIVVDGIGVLIPGVPGVAGLGIVASRQGAKLADPSKIRFSQDSIGDAFTDGRTVSQLTEGLKNGSIRATDVPPIRTLERNGETFTLDNRRLKAFQDAGAPITTTSATAREIKNESFKFTTKNDGTSVRIRSNKTNE